MTLGAAGLIARSTCNNPRVWSLFAGPRVSLSRCLAAGSKMTSRRWNAIGRLSVPKLWLKIVSFIKLPSCSGVFAKFCDGNVQGVVLWVHLKN